MKASLPTSLLTAALLAAPNISVAGPASESTIRINSDLTFSLRITGEGEDVVRNGRTTNRFQTARMGPREVLAALEKLPRPVPSSDEGEEGVVSEPFPRGSHLVATPDRGVWVVDRSGFAIFDAQPYVQVSIDRDDAVVAYNANNTTGDLQEVSVTFTSLNIILPDDMAMAGLETAETDSNITNVYGPVTEDYYERFSRQDRRETVNVSAKTSGTGYRPDVGQIVAQGSVNMRGRESSDLEK